MGSTFNLIFYASDSLAATFLSDECFSLVDSLNQIFSDYLPASELNKLGATSGQDSFVTVSPFLFSVLKTAKQAGADSKGSFDITLGPLTKLWRAFRREHRFPSMEDVALARQRTGLHYLVMDTLASKVKLLQPGMELDLGGIAKGFVAQQVIHFLHSKEIHIALADAGGDIACSDPPPGKRGWILGVNQPHAKSKLMSKKIYASNMAVATSGDVFQFIEHNGKTYSHIIDPRTGYGVPFRRNVTIIAPDGATADWLATACSILPLHEVRVLVKKYKAAYYITRLEKGRITVHLSKGMNGYLYR
jgi:thiamine biosynthesis lipoprotein